MLSEPENRPEQVLVAIRDRGRFVRGSSGNPGGRPKIVGHLQDLARAHTTDALAVLAEVMADADAPAAARVAAATAILDRAWGRPRQAVDLDVDGGAQARADQLLRTIETVTRESICGVQAFVAIASAPAEEVD